MSKSFEKSGVKGTPTLKMDDKKIDTPQTAEQFTAAIDKALQADAGGAPGGAPPHALRQRAGGLPEFARPLHSHVCSRGCTRR